jgi:hypothetical protein
VKVAAHVSAQAVQNDEGKLLKFGHQSAFTGKIIKIAPNSLANRSFVKTCGFMPLFVESHLIAQPLR